MLPPERVANQIHHARRGESAVLTGEAATEKIRRLAERQYGVVARRQLLALGIGKGLIQDRVRSGRLLLLHRGVYSVGHRRLDIRQRWMAAVLACGPKAVLARRSAAQLWDLRGSRGRIEVIRPSGPTCRSGVRVIQARLGSDELTREALIPVTTLERTLLDLASALDMDQLRRAVAAAERSGRLSWSRLRRVVGSGGRHMGIARLRQALSEADPAAIEARSGVEVDFLALCGRAGLPAPSVNVHVEGHLVDFHWPDRRVVVELDSYHFHRGGLAFERDHERTLELESAGIRVLRFTERMLASDPGRVIDRVRLALSR